MRASVALCLDRGSVGGARVESGIVCGSVPTNDIWPPPCLLSVTRGCRVVAGLCQGLNVHCFALTSFGYEESLHLPRQVDLCFVDVGVLGRLGQQQWLALTARARWVVTDEVSEHAFGTKASPTKSSSYGKHAASSTPLQWLRRRHAMEPGSMLWMEVESTPTSVTRPPSQAYGTLPANESCPQAVQRPPAATRPIRWIHVDQLLGQRSPMDGLCHELRLLVTEGTCQGRVLVLASNDQMNRVVETLRYALQSSHRLAHQSSVCRVDGNAWHQGLDSMVWFTGRESFHTAASEPVRRWLDQRDLVANSHIDGNENDDTKFLVASSRQITGLFLPPLDAIIDVRNQRNRFNDSLDPRILLGPEGEGKPKSGENWSLESNHKLSL